MLDLFPWSLRLLIWTMGILLTAMPVHRNVRPLNEESHPEAGAQADGRWTQGVGHVGHMGAEAAMALDPGPLAESGQCRLVPAGRQCVPSHSADMVLGTVLGSLGLSLGKCTFGVRT